eukprot:10318269-Heterocapsa_arctica.AAC.1
MPKRPSWKSVPKITRAEEASPEDEVALRQAGRGEAVLEGRGSRAAAKCRSRRRRPPNGAEELDGAVVA